MMENRAHLADELPLNTPYIVQIFPAYACNFKCEYCIHALIPEKRAFISENIWMDMDLYKKTIDDLCKFEKKVKMLRFAAMGEPLLHPGIVDMIRYAKEKDVASSIEIVTNGALLNHKLSKDLIEAGLSRLRISLEGLSAEDYRKHCGSSIDFNAFAEELKYFYENRKDTVIYIKIIDYMLHSKEEEDRFYATFAPISDQIAVEHLTPTIPEIDYSIIAADSKLDKPQDGDKIFETDICPMAFYFMQVNPDGNIVPCCNTKYPEIFGNVRYENLKDIWNGKAFNSFRGRMLNGIEQVCEVCDRCNIYRYGTQEEDILDDAAGRLREIFPAD